MRKAVLGVMLGSLITGPASAQAQRASRFAITCSGTSTLKLNEITEMDSKVSGIRYIIDEGAETVGQVSLDGSKYHDVCWFDSDCTRTFSATRITVSGDLTRRRTGATPATWPRASRFDWDRTTGRLETRLEFGTSMLHQSLTCKRAKMPRGFEVVGP